MLEYLAEGSHYLPHVLSSSSSTPTPRAVIAFSSLSAFECRRCCFPYRTPGASTPPMVQHQKPSGVPRIHEPSHVLITRAPPRPPRRACVASAAPRRAARPPPDGRPVRGGCTASSSTATRA